MDRLKRFFLNIQNHKLQQEFFLTLSQTTDFRLFQTKRVWKTTISSLLKLAKSSPNREIAH